MANSGGFDTFLSGAIKWRPPPSLLFLPWASKLVTRSARLHVSIGARDSTFSSRPAPFFRTDRWRRRRRRRGRKEGGRRGGGEILFFGATMLLGDLEFRIEMPARTAYVRKPGAKAAARKGEEVRDRGLLLSLSLSIYLLGKDEKWRETNLEF